MTKLMASVKKHALKMTGVAALFVGSVMVTSFKLLWFYQPEYPQVLKK